MLTLRFFAVGGPILCELAGLCRVDTINSDLGSSASSVQVDYVRTENTSAYAKSKEKH